ncbi:MAG: ATP-binding protein [Bacteroidales bacterium]
MRSHAYIKTVLAFIFPFYLLAGNTDTGPAKVYQLYDSAYNIEIDNPGRAIELYRQGITLAEKSGDNTGKGKGLQYIGIVYSDQGSFDSAVSYYLQSLDIFEAINYKTGIAATLVNLGNIYQRQAEYVKATEKYIEGIKIFEAIQDTSRLLFAYNNIGSLFAEVEQYEKSLEYYRKSLEISRVMHDSVNIGYCLFDIGNTELKRGSDEVAEDYLKQALSFCEAGKDVYLLSLIYNSLSVIDANRGHYKEALEKSRESLKYANRLGNPAVTSTCLSQTGFIYKESGQTDSAAWYLRKSIELAKKHEAFNVYLSAFKWMSEVEKNNKNYEDALYWQLRYGSVYNASLGNKQHRLISGLQIKYETEKKDLELKEKELEIERNEALLAKRNYFIIALSGALLSAFVFLILVRRSLHQKRIIAEKNVELTKEKVRQLENEKQVIALKSMLEGQEKERSRIARELHDGLGGLLSTTKLYLDNVQQEKSGNDDTSDLEKAIELVNRTSSEARQIAHNLMPAALDRFGLVEALRDFCADVKASKKLSVDFQSYGLNERLTGSREVSIYRIIQELVNNAIKHANATELLIQMFHSDNKMNITVEDNGRGFDIDKISSNGSGIANIRSRVELMGGSLAIESERGYGSTFNIIIPGV